jgi:hypothetical protein
MVGPKTQKNIAQVPGFLLSTTHQENPHIACDAFCSFHLCYWPTADYSTKSDSDNKEKYIPTSILHWQKQQELLCTGNTTTMTTLPDGNHLLLVHILVILPSNNHSIYGCHQ